MKPDLINMGINVVVVGVGGFGRHYARILSALNRENPAGVPQIDRLIITTTEIEKARRLARDLQPQSSCEVIGVSVYNLESLRRVLDSYKPVFTGIAAKDSEQGDRIHVPYSSAALEYGIALCEKPFTNASGDGKSLEEIEAIKEKLGGERLGEFGLELPFAVVGKKVVENPLLQRILETTSKMNFYWSSKGTEHGNLVDDLALHPWSLIPYHYQSRSKGVDIDYERKKAVITLELNDTKTGRKIDCKMILGYDGKFAGIDLDDFAVGIKSEGATNRLIKLGITLEEAARIGNDSITGEELLVVHNPLKENILASLRGQPTVGSDRVRQSQLFLEVCKGYLP